VHTFIPGGALGMNVPSQERVGASSSPPGTNSLICTRGNIPGTNEKSAQRQMSDSLVVSGEGKNHFMIWRSNLLRWFIMYVWINMTTSLTTANLSQFPSFDGDPFAHHDQFPPSDGDSFPHDEGDRPWRGLEETSASGWRRRTGNGDAG
jgi:hypothetical protein